ncbi:MAG: type 4a pilus biogenesis protein PilO [Proteobacteria bacterium]|jgi:type IV pilus assembly protein PilO|nr:type 4a pilus biogenesis protein PilO [Pseudomonadota bacterium]MCC6630846.1 type 4a pilus biogenesis protein PilO [Gammaproteobacteria bacterium]
MTFDELRQLDPKDPGRWPLPVRLGAIGLIFVVLSLLMLYFLVWNQKKDDLALAQEQERSLRDEFRTKHAKAVNLNLYKQQLEDIQKSFGAMLRQLPGKTEMEALLVDISQTGVGVGLTQQLFQPQPEQSRDFYAERPIKIRLTGTYHQMGEFVSGIAALPRIVTLHNVELKQVQGGAFDQLQLDVTAKTYRYLDDEEVAAVEASRKKNAATTRGSSST